MELNQKRKAFIRFMAGTYDLRILRFNGLNDKQKYYVERSIRKTDSIIGCG